MQGSRFSALRRSPSAPSPAPSSCPLVSCRRPGEWPFRKAPQVEKGLVAVDWHGAGGGWRRRPRGREGGTGRPAERAPQSWGGVPKSGIESLAVCVAILLVIVLRARALRRACRSAPPLRALTSDVCLPALCRRLTHRPDPEEQRLIRSVSGWEYRDSGRRHGWLRVTQVAGDRASLLSYCPLIFASTVSGTEIPRPLAVAPGH